jgi:hypothetical protein
MNDWDGTDRRASGVTLNDILLEVRDVKNDVRHLVEKVDTHVKEDKAAFENIRKDVTFAQRIIFGGIGAWFIIQFFIQIGALRIRDGIFSSNTGSGGIVRSSSDSLGPGEYSTREGSLVRRPTT